MTKLRLGCLAFTGAATAVSVAEWVTTQRVHGTMAWFGAVGWPTTAAIAFLVTVFYGRVERLMNRLEEKLFGPPPATTYVNRLVAVRPFVLEPGDTIIGDRIAGELDLHKSYGEIIDLNASLVDMSEGGPVFNMKSIDHPFQFMFMTSVLAASFGLSANSVQFDGREFIAEVRARGGERLSAAV